MTLNRGWLRARLATRVTVHTKDEQSVTGYLLNVGKDGLVLQAPQLLREGSPVPLDGELFIPKDNVRFVQVAYSFPNQLAEHTAP